MSFEKSTERLVNKSRLSSVQNGTFLVNTGRGGLVDEDAVAEALLSGRLGGYGADVLSMEPPRPQNPLLASPNSFITPHNAWASYEARARLIQIATENLRNFQQGKPTNVVN